MSNPPTWDSAPAERLDPTLDHVLVNGTVVTMEHHDSAAEALIVRDRRILAVGSSRDMLDRAGPRARVTDLSKSVVIPGLIDSHVHLENAENFDRRLDGTRSPAEMVPRIREFVRDRDVDDWIYASAEIEGDWLTGSVVEQAVPDRPMAIAFSGGRYALNKLATADLHLGLAHAEGAEIRYDPDGLGTAVVRTPGEDRLKRLLPSVSLYNERTVEIGVRAGMRALAASGVTTAHHIVRDPLPARVYQRLEASGELQTRIGLIPRVWESDITLEALVELGVAQPFGSDMIRFQGAKVSVDGYFLAGTARFSEPYSGSEDNVGIFRCQPEQLQQLLIDAQRAGIRMCLHANGDVATDACLDAIENAAATVGQRDLRHRIEHFGNLMCTDQQLARIKASGAVAVPNPSFMHQEVQYAADALGAERASQPLPLRRILDAGVATIAGSDYVGDRVCPEQPLGGIGALVTRMGPDGKLYAEDQRLSAYEALELYTSKAAWAAFEDQERGTITAGKFADLTILAGNPLETNGREIASIPVLGTFVGGVRQQA